MESFLLPLLFETFPLWFHGLLQFVPWSGCRQTQKNKISTIEAKDKTCWLHQQTTPLHVLLQWMDRTLFSVIPCAAHLRNRAQVVELDGDPFIAKWLPPVLPSNSGFKAPRVWKLSSVCSMVFALFCFSGIKLQFQNRMFTFCHIYFVASHVCSVVTKGTVVFFFQISYFVLIWDCFVSSSCFTSSAGLCFHVAVIITHGVFRTKPLASLLFFHTCGMLHLFSCRINPESCHLLLKYPGCFFGAGLVTQKLNEKVRVGGGNFGKRKTGGKCGVWAGVLSKKTSCFDEEDRPQRTKNIKELLSRT